MTIPYENVTAVSVVWNEAQRIAPLAAELGMWFRNVVVVVQKSDDDTLALARKTLNQPTHHVIEDEWRGGGDFSMPLALSHVKTPWTFVISGDEMPDLELLRSMPDAIAAMEKGGYSGAMIRCEETLDGVKYVEHPAHVRLFRTSGGWEARHHSAASHENLMPGIWPQGCYIHTRTLEEACVDYLRKLSMMENEAHVELANHNRYAIFVMCNTVAEEKGWRHVWALPQWPEIERRVFAHVDTGLEVL